MEKSVSGKNVSSIELARGCTRLAEACVSLRNLFKVQYMVHAQNVVINHYSMIFTSVYKRGSIYSEVHAR